jgi:hypothetical protein
MDDIREELLVRIGQTVERAVCDEGVFSTDQSLAIQRAIMGAIIPLLNNMPHSIPVNPPGS